MTWMDRAGASDSDRQAWLSERSQGVTATEVRDLMKARDTETAIQRLALVKRSGEPDFGGTADMKWGKQREKVMEDWSLETLELLPESRVFHAVENPRYLASPDGVSIDGSVVGEYKTCGPDLGSKELLELYGDQCQWQMLVIGARCCYLVWETRYGDAGEFEPGAIEWIMIDRDDERIAQLREVVDRFLDVVDHPTEEDEALTELVESYMSARDDAERAKEALTGYLDGAGIRAAKTSRWSLSYSESAGRSSFDIKTFRDENPDLAEKYMRPGKPGAPSLRITHAKNVQYNHDAKEGI